MKRVTPIVKGIKVTPGRRYLLNTNTGNIFPYNKQFAANLDLVECWLTSDTKGNVTGVSLQEPVMLAPIVVPVEEPEPEPIVIQKDVAVPELVELEPTAPVVEEDKPLKPWEKAQLARKQKLAEEKAKG